MQSSSATKKTNVEIQYQQKAESTSNLVRFTQVKSHSPRVVIQDGTDVSEINLNTLSPRKTSPIQEATNNVDQLSNTHSETQTYLKIRMNQAVLRSMPSKAKQGLADSTVMLNIASSSALFSNNHNSTQSLIHSSSSSAARPASMSVESPQENMEDRHQTYPIRAETEVVKSHRKSCWSRSRLPCIFAVALLLLISVAAAVVVPLTLSVLQTTTTIPTTPMMTNTLNMNTSTTTITTASTTTSISTSTLASNSTSYTSTQTSTSSTSSSTSRTSTSSSTSSTSTSSSTSSTSTSTSTSTTSTSSSTSTTSTSSSTSSTSTSSSTSSTSTSSTTSDTSTSTSTSDTSTSTSTSSTSTSTSDTSTSTSTSDTSTSTSTTDTSTSTSSASTSSSTSDTSTSTSSSTETTTSTSSTSSTTETSATTVTTNTYFTSTITSNICTSMINGIVMVVNCLPCVTFPIYYQVHYNFTAISTLTRFVLAYRIGSRFFGLDSVSVRDFLAPATELISNGGFETGDLTNWTYCNQLNASITGGVRTNYTYNGFTYYPQAGSYYYLGGSNASADYLSQSFATQVGHWYTVSLYSLYPGNGTQASADIFLAV